MVKQRRKESEVFSDLAKLCASPGYVHAIAYLCFRDNTVEHGDTVTANDILEKLSSDKLIRTEISTLIGLACKGNLNTELPPLDVLNYLISTTDILLKELHQSMMPTMEDIFNPDMLGDKDFNPFNKGALLREPIFYGGESAYHFQHRDLSYLKYHNDNDWFLVKKGFSIQHAIDVVTSIQLLQNVKLNFEMLQLMDKHPDERSFLSAFKFTAEEVSKVANIEISTVRNVLESFVSTDLYEFNSLDDFNPKNAYPIIKLPGEEYLLFQIYSLMQALYETPFFWLHDDKEYRQTAMQHRGEFAEAFSAERLKLVFGANRVFLNVNIYTSKKTLAGEIDVLVVFANRAIVLQAKSKKLTIAARKGNDNVLQDDFKKAVQNAYDQAFLCSDLLIDKNHKLYDNQGNELDIKREFKEIYPFCIISEHYPALSFQARQFLKFNTTEIIKSPFVMDVFLLDVMTEMLQSPLHLLSYINRRTSYGDKIFSTHELTILSHHLKNNLWMDDQYSMMHLEDDLSVELDLAMLTRREGIQGISTPEGILTKYEGTPFDQLIKEINNLEDPSVVDLGFMLLSISSEAIEMLNDGISRIIKLCKEDGQNHSFTQTFIDSDFGLIIHCNNDHPSVAISRLDSHCRLRKYAQKTNSWYGLCIGPNTPKIKLGINLCYKWVHSAEMDELVKDLPTSQNFNGKFNSPTMPSKKKKTGRNDKCPCGSGKKYKRCCSA
ncbi:SEC-C metal-binding domain-containing protein [Pontibacter indicus]|uniref:Preprotein translocase subunit SecA (ATPase, RNA helicase) n=1 Tax=Pontibacter indicus TaxID=1317125 RepID=A0A1R3WAI8_9BACT|nr:SEC-C metal-binding domain-containing protein [Pontibacter indicus]SIT75009.1 Preprotein translocase subunit SecA (ATPase, RNA helicase) [Pontibacter indicus]